MKKRLIVTAIALITLVVSLSYSAPLANSADLDDAIDTAELFLRQCTDNMYQYHGNDISKMTTSSFSTDKLTKVSAEAKKSVSTTINCSENTSITVEEFPYFIDQKVKYYKKFHSERNMAFNDFNVNYHVYNSNINGNFAVVELLEDISYHYNGGDIQSFAQTDYNVLLYKEDNAWLVCNIISDDDFDRYYKSENLSFEKLNSDAEKETLRLKSEENKKISPTEAPKSLAEVLKEKIENDAKKSDSAQFITDPTGIDYAGYNAACYALTYSTTVYNMDKEKYATDYYNENFYNFYDPENDSYDCQNFVSQCVWAGFEGNNDPKAIDGFLRPMDRDIPQWYCSGNGDHSSSWTVPSGFRDYVASSNNNGAGIVGDIIGTYNTPIDENELQLGDVIIVKNGGHAIIITDFDVESGNLIAYYSAHSASKHNVPLKKDYDRGQIIRPKKYEFSKLYPDGGNHSYSNITSPKNGFDSTCNNTGCAHNRLLVGGSYEPPLTIGSTSDVTICCSSTPYRVAIGIKAPDGTEEWTEALNTWSKSVKYTFSQRGKYIITLAARDKNPDVYSSSVNCYVKYVVRVYK